MALIRWNQGRDAWTELYRVQDQMDRLFRNFMGYDERQRWSVGLFPAMNISSDQKAVTVRYEMPGVPMEKIELSINKDALTIKGERDLAQTAVEASYHRRERRGGVFNRTVTLPVEVDPEKSHATYKDGVLEVVIERAEATLPRQIAIKTE